MVTTKKRHPVKRAAARQPFRPARRGDDGAWLCNVVDSCTDTAVQQASPETLPLCAGCDNAGGEIKGNLEQRRAEFASAVAREDAIKVAAKSRRGEPNETLDVLDHVELRAIAERRKVLGGEIEGLEAAHADVAAGHTHPLFACVKHISKLPS